MEKTYTDQIQVLFGLKPKLSMKSMKLECDFIQQGICCYSRATEL